MFFQKFSFLTGPKVIMSLLSSYFTSNRTISGFTCGILNSDLFRKIWNSSLLRNYAQAREEIWDQRHTGTPNDFLELYSGIQAKIGLEQIKKAYEIIEKREEIAKVYNKGLEHLPGVTCPPIMKGATYSHYTIRVEDRNEFVEEMKNKGIQIRKTFSLTSIQGMLERSKYRNEEEVSNSLIAGNEIANLPNYPSLNRDDIKQICECIKKTL